jgi:hypothetical protein
LLLRPRRLVPDGLENIIVLSLVLVFFQISNAILAESGLATVVVAGVVVGNVKTRALKDMREFKEQLTVLFIGMLFVLLAADVRLSRVASLGWAGIGIVAALMFVVRPVNVFLSTLRTNLSFREKAFLSWLAPRGIVAAAVASLFTETLDDSGVSGGHELRAMVFLVIAITVLVQGLTGGWVARLLRVRRPTNVGFAILGANDLGLALGRVLTSKRKEVVFLDSEAEATRQAEEEGFRVIYGNALEESTLYRAQVDAKAACIAATINEEINFLFTQLVRQEFGAPRVAMGVQINHRSVSTEMVRKAGAKVLFGKPVDLELWDVRLRRGVAAVERWQYENPDVRQMSDGETGEKPSDAKDSGRNEFPDPLMLPLVHRRGERASPVDDRTAFKQGDRLDLAVLQEKREESAQWLTRRGWSFTGNKERDAEPDERATPSHSQE